MAFDGVMPDETIGDLSHNDKFQLFRLNGVPSRPCSARFTLADNSVDSKSILEKIVSMGIQWAFNEHKSQVFSIFVQDRLTSFLPKKTARPFLEQSCHHLLAASDWFTASLRIGHLRDPLRTVRYCIFDLSDL